ALTWAGSTLMAHLVRSTCPGSSATPGPALSQKMVEFSRLRKSGPAAHLAEQPGAGISPVPVGTGARHAEYAGRLFDRQPGKAMDLDQLRRCRVQLGQPVHRVVESQQVIRR